MGSAVGPSSKSAPGTVVGDVKKYQSVHHDAGKELGYFCCLAWDEVITKNFNKMIGDTKNKL